MGEEVAVVQDPGGEDETLCIISLNILSGNVSPAQWKGFVRLDAEEEWLVNVLRQIRHSGFGRLEVSYVRGKIDTAYQTFALKPPPSP